MLETVSTRTSYVAIALVACGALASVYELLPPAEPVLKNVLFAVFVTAALCFTLGLALNLRYPRLGLWPPPSAGTWQFWFVWVSYTTSGVGTACIGVLDWGTLGLDHGWFRVTGVVLLLVAVPLNEWGMRTLSDHQTLGLQGDLVTGGPYRFSRNPQYVAEILSFLGVIVITNSLMGATIGVLVILWFLMAPLAEEPWLIRQFGAQFQAYSSRVPRFLGSIKDP